MQVQSVNCKNPLIAIEGVKLKGGSNIISFDIRNHNTHIYIYKIDIQQCKLPKHIRGEYRVLSLVSPIQCEIKMGQFQCQLFDIRPVLASIDQSRSIFCLCTKTRGFSTSSCQNSHASDIMSYDIPHKEMFVYKQVVVSQMPDFKSNWQSS